MNDVQPSEMESWSFLENTVTRAMEMFGYEQIRTPIVEKTELFIRSLGTTTDIVEKEMYTFKDNLNGESLTLRPEGTAACVRSAVQNNLLYESGKRLWYMGPMFRHERPQRGRFRQFNQIGVEALGFAGYQVDVEHLIMNKKILEGLGLKDIKLEINCLGDRQSRDKFKAELVRYLQKHIDDLDDHSRKRLNTNPLRILDSKNKKTRGVVEKGPKIAEFLSDVSSANFQAIRSTLDHLGIDHTVNHFLVRGLDYYNDLIYEWKTSELGAQGTVSAGGRYDGLFQQLGGKPNVACGFAIGMERILELLKVKDLEVPERSADVYLVYEIGTAMDFAWEVAETLRSQGISVIFNYSGGKFRSQMRRANSSGARYAIILGESEVNKRMVVLKPLRSRDIQQSIPLNSVQNKILKGR